MRYKYWFIVQIYVHCPNGLGKNRPVSSQLLFEGGKNTGANAPEGTPHFFAAFIVKPLEYLPL